MSRAWFMALFFCFLQFFQAGAMDVGDGVTFHSVYHSYNQSLLADIATLQAGDALHMDCFVLTHKKTAEALIEAKARGAVVEVNVNRSFSLNARLARLLEEAGVTIRRSWSDDTSCKKES